MHNPTRLIQKTAVRFAKTGPTIYHSHHDMIRFWERAVQRAGLPLRLTQGFNPRPRLIFPHALGLGIVSRLEEVEIELCSIVPLPEMLERLCRAVTGVLEIVSADALPPVKKSRQIVASSYLISGLPAEADAAGAAAGIMEQTEITVERRNKEGGRRLDIRPYLASLVPAGADALALEIRHTPAGSARLDEVTKLLAAALVCDWRDFRLEKTGMRLE